MECNSQFNTKLAGLVVQQYRKLPRGPYGVETALQAAKQGDVNSIDNDISTDKIISESDTAWRAYYAGKKAAKSQHGFSGKAELVKLLKDLGTESIERRRAFVKQLEYQMQLDPPQLTNENESVSLGNSTKRRRTDHEPTPSLDATPNGSGGHCTLEQISISVNLEEGVHVDASLKKCRALFPAKLMDSIQRIPHTRLPDTLVADVSMVLQKGDIRDRFGCQMEIGIEKEKVAYYAKRMFNVEVEARDRVRYIRYPGGSKVEPDPSIKLRACIRNVIPDIFGAEVDRGFSSAPIYQREEKEVREHTDGVSMTISNQETEGGKITLYLGEWHAFNFKTQLYT